MIQSESVFKDSSFDRMIMGKSKGGFDMAILSKKQMSEEDIKLNFITPAIQPGWQGHITMETKITDGRINIRGNMVARSKPKFADYMLYLNDGKPIAVVEAKDNTKGK